MERLRDPVTDADLSAQPEAFDIAREDDLGKLTRKCRGRIFSLVGDLYEAPSRGDRSRRTDDLDRGRAFSSFGAVERALSGTDSPGDFLVVRQHALGGPPGPGRNQGAALSADRALALGCISTTCPMNWPPRPNEMSRPSSERSRIDRSPGAHRMYNASQARIENAVTSPSRGRTATPRDDYGCDP